MGYVRRRQDCWYIGFKDEVGRWKEEATKARTKGEARRMADERENQADLLRRGLATPAPPPLTFDELADKYLKVSSTKVHPRPWMVSRLKHLRPLLGKRLLSQITTESIEALLVDKAVTLSDCSVEHLRRQLRAMFNAAIRWKLMHEPNPAAAVPARDVQRRQTQYLESDEIPRLLGVLPLRWRTFFAVGIYAGLRKGELAGLRWSDIDFARRLITVARSYALSTKTKRVRQVEICDELLAFLLDETKRRRSELVFPLGDGTMMARHHDVCRVFQNALKRAGIVVGYDLVCRRSGCGYKERRATGDEARCPTCNMALWVKPVPKPLRFHDTRSTFGTHLRERTGDIVLVQKRLGHSSPAITAEIYSGVRTPYAMEMINKLHFGSTPISGSVSGTLPAEAPGPVPPTSPSIGQAREMSRESERALGESNPRPLAPEANALSS